MSAFRFRLATLLKMREAVRDQRRAALAEALHAIALLDEQLNRLRSDLGDQKQQLHAAARPGRVDVDRLLEAQRYEFVLLGEITRLSQQRQTVSTEAENRREALVVADREVKVLEKLREKQQLRQRAQDEREDIKRFDEIAGRIGAVEGAF
ncbi:MAG TPA: flagellar export protein FliJ [Pirellulales bacterium]|jgi:flagellar export protein FliJ|nr:flagellar export protein FliJ [Pirellulales bacterium]